jgi:hypothetical protein
VVKLGGVSMCGGTVAIFVGVLIYIFFNFFSMGPPCAFQGCHKAASDLSTFEC